MTDLIKKCVRSQAIRYIFFGGCTTMVNLVSYWILRRLAGIGVTEANFFAIALSILFAYAVNKIFVFESRTRGIAALLKEMGQFVGMRLLTMFIEIMGVVLLCCVWNLPDMGAKIVIQFVVLVLNFVFSKMFVFRKKEDLTQEEKKKNRTRKFCTVLSALIPGITIFIAFAINGVYPFGDHGVLIIDSLHQYLPFFTNLHNKLADVQSLTYSFGGGLGYNMWAVFAYYLASPLNLLITIVSGDHVMDFMAYLIMVKIALTGGIFGWYLSVRGNDRDYLPVPFACMYALSAFIIGYYFNIMWLDSIMVLPLIMLGIENIVAGRHGRGYALALFYGLYCNYYIGYMLCLFSCLYFLAQWMGAKKFRIRNFILSGLKFTGFSLLSGGMAAFVLLPAYLNLGITESAGSSFPSKIKFYTDGITQLTGHFAFAEPINIYDNQAGVNIYCGVAVMILIGLYILNSEIRFAERMSRLILVILIAFSMNFNMLNYIWHGFHTQNGLPNRFAFLYIALLLTMSFDALRNIRKIRIPQLLLSWFLAIGFTAYCTVMQVGERPWYVYMATLLFLMLYGILFLWYHETGKRKGLAKQMILFILSAEMVSYGIFGVCMNGTVGRSTYVNEQLAYQAMMLRDETGDDFFRSEIDSQRMRNENMFMGANGVVLFSSTMPEATVELCRRIGLEARTNKNGYNGMTKLFNDVFGIRYLVSKRESDTLYQMTQCDYEDPLYLYRNDGALSLGFMVSSNIKEWDIYANEEPMIVQEQFAYLATGIPFQYTLRESYSLEEGPVYIIRLHPGEQTYVDFNGNVKSLTIRTPQGEKTINNYTDNVFNLGMVTEEGEDSKANLSLVQKDGKTAPIPVKVYTCTDGEYQKVHDKLAESQMEETEISGSRITGKIHAAEDGTLLLTIPYDTGWTVSVDGETKETYRVGEALMGLDLAAGDHEITMDYVPDGLKQGTIISVICMLFYMIGSLIEVFYEKKESGKSLNEENEDESYVF